MRRFLRKINKNKWFEAGTTSPALEELRADPVGDLATSGGGKLSVWVVEDGDQNLERVVCALASTMSSLQHMSFITFDPEDLVPLGVEHEHNEGDSRDIEANRKWHYDLVIPTAIKLVHFARHLWAQSTPQIILQKQLRAYMLKAIEAGTIRRDKLAPKIQEELAKQ